MMITTAIIFVIAVVFFILDRRNKKHTIQSNFPVIGWVRRLFERFGPELRQYIVSNNREELPFNRTQRSWIYATSKRENALEGFGSDADFNQEGHVFVMHSHDPLNEHPHLGPTLCIHGGREVPTPARDAFKTKRFIGPYRAKPYKPNVVNISAMSYGATSPTAVKALNTGACISGSFHNTGEGGYHPELHHTVVGGAESDVVFQIGTGYFGCRDEAGSFSMGKLVRLAKDNPNIKMIEIKLSQGAKPGHGGVLPGVKVNKSIAEARGIPIGQDAISPPGHTAFRGVDGLIEFIEEIARYTGLPVGIKSAVSGPQFWDELFGAMRATNQGPDFITVDGGEGGTGAAPVAFAAHVALPLNEALALVCGKKDDFGVDPFIIASAKLGFSAQVLKAMSFGAESVNVAREALMSIGCIQAQKCHTNRCPSGVATQNKWLYKGLDPADKGARCANYLLGLMEEVFSMSAACGFKHPNDLTRSHVKIRKGGNIVSIEDLMKKENIILIKPQCRT